MTISKEKIMLAEKCLIDNGIEESEAEIVLQALGYILLDMELYPDEDGKLTEDVVEKYIIERINSVIERLDRYINNVDKFQGDKRVSYYLNIEHCIGEYHAYIYYLAKFSEKFMVLQSVFEEHITNGIKALEGLYQLSRENFTTK